MRRMQELIHLLTCTVPDDETTRVMLNELFAIFEIAAKKISEQFNQWKS